MKSKFSLASLFAALQLLAFSSIAYAEETKKAPIKVNNLVENLLKTQKERENQPFWVQHNYIRQTMM